MDLLKMLHDPARNKSAQQKAIDSLNSIPSHDSILWAYLMGQYKEIDILNSKYAWIRVYNGPIGILARI